MYAEPFFLPDCIAIDGSCSYSLREDIADNKAFLSNTGIFLSLATQFFVLFVIRSLSLKLSPRY